MTATNKVLDRRVTRFQHGWMRRRWKVRAGVGLLLLCAGCGDLREVTQLGAVADVLGRALPGVSADLYASCERRAALVERIPRTERPSGISPDCGPAQAVAMRLGADESALTEYLRTLSRLGASATLTYGKALGADVTTVNDFGVSAGPNKELAADSQRATVAALTLTSKLADLASRHLRARDVRRIVVEANPGVQALTAALYQVGDADYGSELADERGFLDAYYQGPIAAGTGDRLTLILVQRQYDSDVERLKRRQSAAAEYGAVMQEIGTLHAKLTEAARDSAGFEGRVKALAPQVEQLRDAVAKLETGVQ